MRYAILADIHANLEALEAVLKDLEKRGGADEIWCLGDIVGYGPDPGPCIKRLVSYPHQAVAGNHDWAAIGRLALSAFNPDAAAAALWTADQLSPQEVHYLDSLPLQIIKGDFTLVHGSPRSPLWEYIIAPLTAQASFPLFSTPYCLVGHTHIPALFQERRGMGLLPPLLPLSEERLIVNPGGVGQPRDGDPRAAYTLYDEGTRTLHHFRVSYDVGRTQHKMMGKGLPPTLAARLSLGW